MISYLIKIAVLAALATACGAAASACTVAPGEYAASLQSMVKNAVGRSAAVFAGKVTAIDYIPANDPAGSGRENQVVRLAASAWWKGIGSRAVTLHTANSRDAAGNTGMEAHQYPYEVGKSYLIYAYESRDGLHADICTRTKAMAEAGGEIPVLDALKAKADG
nr:hypothetical protein [uncultured Duganella sp.]